MEPVFLATIYRWLLEQVVFHVEIVQLGPAVVATMGGGCPLHAGSGSYNHTLQGLS